MTNDLVSIIMPVYNRNSVINRAITSIKNQTYKNWELIVIDDFSTDNTFEVISNLAKENKKISVYRNEKSKGISGARNTGLCKIKGSFIAFLDSDDEWMPYHLYESMKTINEEKVPFCFSIWSVKNNKGKIRKRFETSVDQAKYFESISKIPHKKNKKIYIFDKNFYEYTLINNFVIYHINSLVVSKQLVMQIGFFDEKLHASEDSDFIFRLLRNNSFAFIDNVHFYYYQGEDNIYNFIDRKSIDFEEIRYNKEIIKKLSYCLDNKCKMLKKRITIIKQDKKNFRKFRKCNKATKSMLARKLFVLFFLHSIINKKKALEYLSESMKYSNSLKKIIIFVIYKLTKKMVGVQREELNFY